MHHHHNHALDSKHPGGHHLLLVEKLSVGFDMYDKKHSFFLAPQTNRKIINDLTLSVHYGELVAVVGASGSGKSVLADTILGISPQNAQVKGTIWFDGEKLKPKDIAQYLGSDISFVPQGVSALDPVHTIEHQALAGVPHALRQTKRQRLLELIDHYQLAQEVLRAYPHELSGGMIRRVLLSLALLDNPRLLIADEPTPGLDPELANCAMRDLKDFTAQGGGVLMITHDLDLACAYADRIAFFNNGGIVEETSTSRTLAIQDLQSDYAKALMQARPSESGFLCH